MSQRWRQNYSIYRFGDRLFSYLEHVGDDFEADMAAEPATCKCWGETAPCQLPLLPGVKWADMEALFRLD